MGSRRALAFFLCAAGLLPPGHALAVEPSSSVYHFEIKHEEPGPKPLRFPFGLQPGAKKADVTQTLHDLGIYQDDFDTDETVWRLKGQFDDKGFRPTRLMLKYKFDGLMQVMLVQPNMTECPQVMSMVQDAVASIQEHYILTPGSIQKGPHFGASNCFFFLKPEQSGWGATGGDFAVNVDSVWRDMVYGGYVTLSYMPLFNQADSSSTRKTP